MYVVGGYRLWQTGELLCSSEQSHISYASVYDNIHMWLMRLMIDDIDIFRSGYKSNSLSVRSHRRTTI